MIRIDIHKRLKAEQGKLDLHINTEIKEGELVTLYGPSGAGKTSTLRMLAGLMDPDDGCIQVADTLWFNAAKRINRKPQLRNIGFVFQDYALFPNMSVLQNLQYADKSGRKASLIESVIEIMELQELKYSKPGILSGGQKQRVALARALVQQPQVLLLDEPLTALDPKMRLKLQEYLIKAHKEFGLTTLLVSHNISEISRLSSKVLVLEDGKIIKSGPPASVLVNQNISGKFKFIGEVLSIEPSDLLFIVTVLIQDQLTRVVATETEASGIQVGDHVLVASKAFNPVIYKLDL